MRDAIETKNDIGANEILGKYSKSRKNIINGRIFGVSLLNTASKSSNPSVQRARQMGLKFLANNSYVRKAVMRIGLGDLDFFQR